MLGAYLIKIYMNIVEFLARIFIFNRNMPRGSLLYKNIKYSNHGILDAFVPKKIESNAPVIVYIHGGGWVTGSRKTSRRICSVFSSEGYVVLNLKYRLGPRNRHPAALIDISSALNWLNSHFEEYKADINNIFLAGSSAGAHLACMTACIATNSELSRITGVEMPVKSENISGLILVYGGFNMKTIVNSGFFMIKTMVKAYAGTLDMNSEIIKQISPVEFITDNFPPVFITAGECDHLYGQSVELVKILREKKLSFETLFFKKEVKNAGHGFYYFYNRECTKQAYIKSLEFMKRHAVN